MGELAHEGMTMMVITYEMGFARSAVLDQGCWQIGHCAVCNDLAFALRHCDDLDFTGQTVGPARYLLDDFWCGADRHV